MEYRNLGNSGLQVSIVGLGCNNLGRTVDPEATQILINQCIESGITFFDTADVYGERGRSEENLGRALKPHRRNVVLATKGGAGMGSGPYSRGGSRRYLMDALEASLRRLDTDYVDLYQLHQPDARTPIEETLRALDDMVRSGKVRYVGCSNFNGWQVVEAAWTSKTQHLTPLISAQNEFNMLHREPQKELLPACAKYGLGILPYYPLASGLLTGKYSGNQPPPEGTRFSHNFAVYSGVFEGADFSVIDRLMSFARERGHTGVELAMGWLVSQPVVSSVIAGATKPEQVEENARSADWRLTPDEMKEIEAILAGSSSNN